LSESVNLQDSVSVSPDGTWLMINETSPTTGIDMMQLELGDGSTSVDGRRGQSVPSRSSMRVTFSRAATLAVSMTSHLTASAS